MAEFLEALRRLQCLPGMRVEPAPNSEYAPISEMCLIMHDYGIQDHFSPTQAVVERDMGLS